MSAYRCPYCQTRSLETTSRAPYVRGFVLAYQLGYRNLVGCVPCVRRRILREAGVSALLGWFSITALIINPFLILYNLIQAPFVKARPARVSKLLRNMGLPQSPEQVDITDAGYALAASMITADGKIDPREVEVARSQGKLIFGRFDDPEFRRLLEEYKELPPATDIAAMLGTHLTTQNKGQIFRYLQEIAMSDGEFAEAEKELLQEVASRLHYTPPEASSAL